MAALKFRVLLDSEKNQEVFRDILIDEKSNFEELFRTITNAFNFEGNEMASFYMSNDEWDKGHEIGLFDMRYSDDESEDLSVMKDAIIADFIEVADQKIILVYDFLRMWIFLLELIERTDEVITTPKVLLSVGVAPPEDSRMIQEDAFHGEEDDDEMNEFDEDFEDGYDEEDFSNFEEYEY
jgi:hypothetical protein